ncbi:hypothetical protein [Paenarthrobacter sp. NPDC090522]|uniref:hypothetical protein n=1 Tax=Paenarthrobacter sp. NPDC090522 TaxID=3364383 RepID=UPI003815478A
MNIADASVETLAVFKGGEETASGCIGSTPSGQMSGPRYRQTFSPDLKRMAVSWRDATSNSHRVGYIEAATGKRTDVTAILNGGEDFSAAPQHNNAMFDPDGSFFFRDIKANNFKWVDLTTMKVTKTSTPDDMRGDNWWIGVGGEPQSEAEDITAGGPDQILPVTTDDAALSWLDSNRSLAVHYVFDGTATSHAFLGILKAHVKQADGKAPSDSFTAITPESDFNITSAVADDKKENVFFTAYRGKEAYLFSVPLDGSSAPKRIGAFKADARLIDYAAQ